MPERGLFYDTEDGQKDLIVRPRNDSDGVVPSGASAATLIMLMVSHLTGDAKYRALAEQNLRSVQQVMGPNPLGYSQWLCDLDFYLAAPQEIALVGVLADPETQKLKQAICSKWMPDKVMAALGLDDPEAIKDLPIFKDRPMVDGKPTVYLCQNYTCQSPITDVETLKTQLGAFPILRGGSPSAERYSRRVPAGRIPETAFFKAFLSPDIPIQGSQIDSFQLGLPENIVQKQC